MSVDGLPFWQWARFQGHHAPMNIDQIGEISFERPLALDGVDSVMVVVGVPRPHPEGDFFWPWRFGGSAAGIERRSSGELEIFRIESGVFCSAGQHAGPDLVTIVEREHKIRPAHAARGSV